MATDMRQVILDELDQLIRETFDGGLPGQGTAYLDHDSGVRNTLGRLTAEQASHRFDGHPSIAAHVRHMNFHLRTSVEWIQGDHSRRNWRESFEPQHVTEAEWKALQEELDQSRVAYQRLMRTLPAEKMEEEGSGMGVLAHLAYHLGAVRQLMHLV